MACYGKTIERLRVVINDSDNDCPPYYPIEVFWRGRPVAYVAVELRVRGFDVEVARIVRHSASMRGPDRPGEADMWEDMKGNGVQVVEEG